ncbi:YodL domain-containing protein [Lachnospiraceae bacterium HCP28S3_F9]
MKTINGLFLMFILMERRKDGRKEYTAKNKIFSKITREGLTEETLRHNSVSLDELYSIFNQNHPDDFKGHSMSVSDVVIVNRDGDIKAFYVDSFGFADLLDFVRQRQEILGVESTEPYLDAR